MTPRVPVLIVGGGPAGLISYILLRQNGVPAELYERRDGIPRLPKAHIVNQRTVEILDQCGVLDRVRAQGSPHVNMSRVAWYTSFAGPTDLHGRELGRCDSWGGGALLSSHLGASPVTTTNLSQLLLEPILLERAWELAPDGVHLESEVTGLEQLDGGVRARIRSADGTVETVEANHVLAADGGRTVAALLGIEMEGERELVRMISSHIVVDLRELNPDPDVCIFWFVNPDIGGSIGSGVLVKMGGSGWGEDADEWVFSVAALPGDPADYFDEDYVIERARRSIGVEDIEVEVRRISEWRLESVVAERFSQGNVYLLGDAAHRHPPTGGLGLNTAAADAHNLAWKLTMVLAGKAGRGLLETYGQERRPVALRNAKQSLESFFDHGQVDAALGLAPDLSPEAGWEAIAERFADTPAGEEKRAAVAVALRNKRHEFCAQNLEVGYCYEDGAVVPDGTELAAREDDVTDFIPSSHPGHRLPHAWLEGGSGRVSTIWLTRPDRLLLLVGEAGEAWRAAAGTVAERLGIELEVVGIGPGQEYTDPTGQWAAQSEIKADGALLVRPDQHVAWRSPTLADDAAGTLATAIGQVLGLPD